MQNKNNKIIVISGGSSGLGALFVEMANASGHTAVSLSRTNPTNYANHITCDVSDSLSVEAAAAQIKEQYGRVDILINNAGHGIWGTGEDLPDEEVVKVMDTNYFGALRLSRSLLPLMDKTARIVNISSVCALFAIPYYGAYCSAKAAVNMLSYSMRMELKRFGIRVISICPGGIRTPFSKNRTVFTKENEKYGDSPKISAIDYDKNDHKRMCPKKAANKMFKIALNKNGPLYIIGTKYKFFNFMQRLLPTRAFNAIINKVFNKQ